MSAPEDLLTTAAASPQSVTTPNATVVSHPLADVIQYADRAAKKAASARGPFGGLQVGRWTPPSAVGPRSG